MRLTEVKIYNNGERTGNYKLLPACSRPWQSYGQRSHVLKYNTYIITIDLDSNEKLHLYIQCHKPWLQIYINTSLPRHHFKTIKHLFITFVFGGN